MVTLGFDQLCGEGTDQHLPGGGGVADRRDRQEGVEGGHC